MTAFRQIWQILLPRQRRQALLLVVMLLIGVFLEMLSIGLVVPLIAVLMQDNPAQYFPVLQPAFDSLGQIDQQTLMLTGLLVFVSAYVIKILFLALFCWYQTRVIFLVQAKISERLFDVYLQQPYSFHLQRNSAQLIRNISGEVGLFATGGMMSSLRLLSELLILTGLVILLLFAEPLGSLFVVGLFVVVVGGFHGLTRHRLRRWGSLRQHHDGLIMQHLQQGLGGIKAAKLGGYEATFLRQYSTNMSCAVRVQRKQHVLDQMPRLGLELLAISALAILVMSLVLQGRDPVIVLPVLGMFVAVAFRLMPSINRIITTSQYINYSLPAIDKVYTELIVDAPPPAATGATEKHTSFTRLVMDGVFYTYPKATVPALRQISLMINKGEAVGIVGESGAGKSTLIDVLLGLLASQEGDITIDGAPMQATLRCWQRQIGYVPQSIYLTDDSIRRNIAFGVPEKSIDDVAVLRAIQAAQLSRFITGLPDGIETRVGELGVRLSGGQRQRIGIARALYHNPAVLVLDEATSSLDMITEREVMQAVMALQGDRTLIIVAHRFSTIRYCDRLYRLHNGEIVQSGSPDDIAFDQPAPGIVAVAGK